MKPYLALIANDLRLALRERAVIFFNYLFPLAIFFGLGELMHAERAVGLATLVVTSVLVIGVLGNGLFGAGLRTVVDREAGILRRFKVTPITPLPVLTASLVTGWLLYLPNLLLIIGLAHVLWRMPLPARPISLIVLLSVGVVTFRAIGLIIAAVANSTGESNILVQLFYMPMMFLSGATVPIALLPGWAQTMATFMPAFYLVSGIQGIFQRGESLFTNLAPLAALLTTMAVAIFIATQLFRWEKEQPIAPLSKLWVAGVLVPFVALGVNEARTHSERTRTQTAFRASQRQATFLIRGARIFVGDGRVIDSGGILIRNGQIEEVYDGVVPDPATLKADVLEAAGQTVLPGLIDVHVHLSASGGVEGKTQPDGPADAMPRALAQYLYAGITTVKSAGDPLLPSIEARDRLARGERLGAELFVSGPMFTGPGGAAWELPQLAAKQDADAGIARTAGSADQARQQMQELATAGVDGVDAVFETSLGRTIFERLDVALLDVIGEEARRLRRPLVVHTGQSRDVADAIGAGAAALEHGSRERLSDELLSRLKESGAAYDPTLSRWEAQDHLARGRTDLLDRSLIQQSVPPAVLTATRAMLADPHHPLREAAAEGQRPLAGQADNLKRAYDAGVTLVAGSDAGNLLVFHGPTVQRELQLWVAAGIPPAAALQAATWNAARLLRADARLGLVARGHDADLLIVDGNPLADITTIERISVVVFKGERVRRAALFTEGQNAAQ